MRLVFFSVLSLLLLFVDARYRYLETSRAALSVVVAPIQKLATLPGVLWEQISNAYITQDAQHSLMAENEAFHSQHQNDAAQLLQLQSLRLENQQLRGLLELPLRNEFTSQVTEIIYADRDVFRRRVIVNKGASANIQAGQVVMDGEGIVGQVTRVYPWLSEVTLITEKDHAVPVQILRNGLRTILFGSGDTSQLSLRYMPVGADIQNDDVLVTSGIDGTYPAGVPVAKVTSIERDPAYPFAKVVCLPLAGVDRHRQLLILSTQPRLQERTAEKYEAGDGDRRLKVRRKN